MGFYPVLLFLGVAGLIYLVLRLGRWKVLLAYVAISVALVIWIVMLMAGDPAGADGGSSLLAIAGLLLSVAIIRATVLSVTSR
jgi:hypothetical protein